MPHRIALIPVLSRCRPRMGRGCRLALRLAALTGMTAAGWADEPPTVALTLAPSLVSHYMFRGVDAGGPALQPTIEAGRGPLALGLWASVPLRDDASSVDRSDLDLYGAYTVALNDRFSVMPGFTWYNHPRVGRNTRAQAATFEPSVAFNVLAGGVRLTPKIYYDTRLDGPTAELAAASALPLPRLGTELDVVLTVGTFCWRSAKDRSGASVENRGDYWQCEVSVPYAITRNSRLTAGLAFAQGWNNYFQRDGAPKEANPGSVGRLVVTLRYAVSF